jgi:hypothetical protein
VTDIERPTDALVDSLEEPALLSKLGERGGRRPLLPRNLESDRGLGARQRLAEDLKLARDQRIGPLDERAMRLLPVDERDLYPLREFTVLRRSEEGVLPDRVARIPLTEEDGVLEDHDTEAL